MLELDNVKPAPLAETGLDIKSQTWGKNIKFHKGKKYLITAPSGKGKSTLVHLIYGIRNDYEGKVFFEEKELRLLEPEAWAELRQKRFSIVFQNLRLFPQLTVRENLQIKANLSEYKTEAQFVQMAEQLGIGTLLDQKCGQLSYGQRQRVAIIRSLCQPFDFLLLDEPFSHLDEDNIKKATVLIEDALKEQGAGMLLVSLGERYFFRYDEEIVL